MPASDPYYTCSDHLHLGIPDQGRYWARSTYLHQNQGPSGCRWADATSPAVASSSAIPRKAWIEMVGSWGTRDQHRAVIWCKVISRLKRVGVESMFFFGWSVNLIDVVCIDGFQRFECKRCCFEVIIVWHVVSLVDRIIESIIFFSGMSIYLHLHHFLK